MGSPSHQPPLEILLGYEFLKGNREIVSVIEIGVQSHQEFFFQIQVFIYLFMAALGLHCCARAFSSCGAQACHCSDFPSSLEQLLGHQGLVACGIFPEQGLNLCPLHELASQFSTTGPPGKSYVSCLKLLEKLGFPLWLSW